MGVVKRVSLVFVVIVMAVALIGIAPPPKAGATGGYPDDDAVPCGSGIWCKGGSVNSPRGYAYKNCTDFVAWKLAVTNGYTVPRTLGNAGQWGYRTGATVNGTPARGSVAWWDSGSHNHVAWVSAVHGDQVHIEEYNWGTPGQYGARTINKTEPTGYIHFRDLPNTDSFADGTLVRAHDTGRVYIMAGGAPLYVQSWSNVGGKKPISASLTQSAINAMPKYPKDGTFLREHTTGKVYAVAGGARMYVSSWSNVGGKKPHVNVDGWSIRNQLRQYPADGTYIESGTTGRVYVVAGGAPLYVQSWSNIGGERSRPIVDQVAIDGLRDHPSDGTYIHEYTTGRVYVVAGGTAMYVSSWDNVGGVKPYTNVDGWAIRNQFRQHPKNDTYIRSGTTGRVYVVAGGAPMYVQSWDNVGGERSNIVTVDPVAIDKLREYPLDGTFVREYTTGKVYLISNQSAEYISDPDQVTSTPVNVDGWAIRNQLGV
jgi:hypothetical protein